MIENVLAEPTDFLHMDTLFSVVEAKVDADPRFPLMADSPYRHLSRSRGNRHWPCRTRQISNHIVLTDATIRICQSRIEVLLGRRAIPVLLPRASKQPGPPQEDRTMRRR